MIKILLSSLLFTSQALAGLPPTTIKGQSDSGKATTFNFEVPYNQATSTAAVTKLLETGNNNLLLNPSFEGETQTTGWTVGTGVTPSAGSTFTHGKKSLHANMVNVSGNVYSQSVTPGVTTLGRNFEHSIWLKNSAPNIQVCALQAGVAVAGQCIEASQDNLWHQYQFFLAGPSSGSIGIGVSTFALASGNLDIDEAYVGIARLGQGIPPNEFTAEVSSAGVISNITPPGSTFITGAAPSSGVFNLTLNGFSSAPNCLVQTVSTGSIVADKIVTSNSLSYKTWTSDTHSAAATAATVKCTKTGADFIQPAITAQNWNYDWKTCSSITSSWVSNTTLACKEKRDGGQVFYDITVSTSGAPTATGLTVTVPKTLDTGRISSSAEQIVGSEVIFNDSGTAYSGLVRWSSGGTFSIAAQTANLSYVTTPQASNTVPTTFGSGDVINIKFNFPALENGVSWTETWNALQLVGSVVYDTAIKTGGINGVTSMEYGSYSAALTNVANAASIVTPATCYYDRIGPKVNVTCRTSTGCTSAGGTSTQYNVTLPIATTQSTTITGSASMLGAVGTGGRIIDNGSNLAQVQFACQSTAPGTHNLIFSYQVP